MLPIASLLSCIPYLLTRPDLLPLRHAPFSSSRRQSLSVFIQPRARRSCTSQSKGPVPMYRETPTTPNSHSTHRPTIPVSLPACLPPPAQPSLCVSPVREWEDLEVLQTPHQYRPSAPIAIPTYEWRINLGLACRARPPCRPTKTGLGAPRHVGARIAPDAGILPTPSSGTP